MTIRYSALIVDDEPNLRHFLIGRLSELWPQLNIVGQASNGKEALDLIENYQPDIIFLDIRMPGLDGMTLAKQLAQNACAPLIVFTTAYDQYALEAFESEAIDYLLKPINDARLIKAIDKLKTRLKEKTPSNTDQNSAIASLLKQLNPPQSIPQYLEWIKASRHENTHLISIEEVSYFQAQDKCTSVFTSDSEYIIRTSIKDLKAQVDPSKLWQISRSTLVKVADIAKVKREFSGRMYVYLKDGKTKLPVSRSSQSLFKQM